jgi:hypothetical protein
MKRRDFVRLLEGHGYQLLREGANSQYSPIVLPGTYQLFPATMTPMMSWPRRSAKI